jgi:hypothetical protein
MQSHSLRGGGKKEEKKKTFWRLRIETLSFLSQQFLG